MASSKQGPSVDCKPPPAIFVDAKVLEERILKCPVCHEKFDSNKQSDRSPRQLQCCHTFCLQCLTVVDQNEENVQIKSRNCLKCPLCRDLHKLGQGGIGQVPVNLTIIQVMDILSVAEKESRKVCHQHQQQSLLFFCTTCGVPVCRDCTVVAHKETKGHEVVEIKDASKQIILNFINIRDRVKDISEILRARSDMTDQAREQITENRANEETRIRNAFADYRAKLDEREKAMLAHFGLCVDNDQAQLTAFSEFVDLQISTIRKLDEQMEEARKQGDLRQLLTLLRQMEEWEKTSTYLANLNCNFSWYTFTPRGEGSFQTNVNELGNIERNLNVQQQQQELVTGPGFSAGFGHTSSGELQQSLAASDAQEESLEEQRARYYSARTAP